MKQYDPKTLKTFRRLRAAFRRAMTIEMRRSAGKCDREAAKLACARIAARAVSLGWLSLHKELGGK